MQPWTTKYNRMQRRVKLTTTWLLIVCNNLLSRVTGIRRRKPSNLLLYRKSCKVWGKNPSNMKCFNRHSIYDSDRSCIYFARKYWQQAVPSLAMWFTQNVPCIFAVWAWMFNKNWFLAKRRPPRFKISSRPKRACITRASQGQRDFPLAIMHLSM